MALYLRPLETGLPFYVIIRATWRSSRLQGKGSTFISQVFEDPECWSSPGNRTHDLPLCSQAPYPPKVLRKFNTCLVLYIPVPNRLDELGGASVIIWLVASVLGFCPQTQEFNETRPLLRSSLRVKGFNFSCCFTLSYAIFIVLTGSRSL